MIRSKSNSTTGMYGIQHQGPRNSSTSSLLSLMWHLNLKLTNDHSLLLPYHGQARKVWYDMVRRTRWLHELGSDVTVKGWREQLGNVVRLSCVDSTRSVSTRSASECWIIENNTWSTTALDIKIRFWASPPHKFQAVFHNCIKNQKDTIHYDVDLQQRNHPYCSQEF